jgi:hypothetical protein
MVSLFVTTIACFVKSRPDVSVPEWHSTQYVVKKPCAQLTQVSDAASAAGLPLLLPLPLDDPPLLDPGAGDELEEHAPVAAPATEKTRRAADGLMPAS